MNKWFDIAIIGGGPAGTATAIALARSGRAVIVLERSHYEQARIGETLPPVAQLPLVNLGIWDRFIADGHIRSAGIISAWGQDELDEEHFIFSPYGEGWHLDRQRFDAMLALTAEEAGARVCRGARVASCSPTHSGQWQVEFTADGKRALLRARFLVDATGRSAVLARRQGARRIAYDRLIGIVGFFSARSSEGESDDRTLVEAVENGWWYSAWLPSFRLVVAYMTDADVMPNGRAGLAEHWQNRLKQAPHTSSRVGRGVIENNSVIVAADSFRMNRVTGNNWLAVGDAATAYDPLSSHGLCKALESGLEAGRVIANCEPRHQAALAEYERWNQTQFEEYLKVRQMHYGREKRWPASAFWQRRQPE